MKLGSVTNLLRRTTHLCALLAAQALASQPPVVPVYRSIGGKLYDFAPLILAGTNANPFYIEGTCDRATPNQVMLRRIISTKLIIHDPDLISGDTRDQLTHLYVHSLLNRDKPIGAGEFGALSPEAKDLYLRLLRTADHEVRTEPTVLLRYPLQVGPGAPIRAFAMPLYRTNGVMVWDFGTVVPQTALTNYSTVTRLTPRGLIPDKLSR
jgi:hypothetical protein